VVFTLVVCRYLLEFGFVLWIFLYIASAIAMVSMHAEKREIVSIVSLILALILLALSCVKCPKGDAKEDLEGNAEEPNDKD